MSERFYPPTEEELSKRRILTPQPSRAPYSPSVDYFEASPAPPPAIAKPPGCVFIKPCQLPDGITHYFNPAGYVPLELIKEYSHLSLLGWGNWHCVRRFWSRRPLPSCPLLVDC